MTAFVNMNMNVSVNVNVDLHVERERPFDAHLLDEGSTSAS